MHDASGFDYRMPDLSSPIFIVKRVVKDDEGRVVGAGALRLQVETYLWLDKNQPVRVRWKVVSLLGRSLAAEAWGVGLDCLVAWLPPNLPLSFKKLLTKLGWSPSRDGWQSWEKPLE